MNDNVAIEICDEGVFVVNTDTRQGAKFTGSVLLAVDDATLLEACNILQVDIKDVIRIAGKFYDTFALEGEAYG